MINLEILFGDFSVCSKKENSIIIFINLLTIYSWYKCFYNNSYYFAFIQCIQD